MIWKKGSLWKFFLRHLARTQGFLDPVGIFASLQHFSKPSEVWVPTELLRLGAIMQARGLINSQAIQNNLDWVWPFWVSHQFNPQDKAFIPRAFSISHINLTHRNWTALGVPDFGEYPLVDPRGLVTPFWDGWSLDCWLMGENHPSLFPSQLHDVHQELDHQDILRITTTSHLEKSTLEVQAWVEVNNGIPVCKVRFSADAPFKCWMAVCLRPYNPEGISFIHDIKRLTDRDGWKVNGRKEIYLEEPPLHYVYSNYHQGDVSRLIPLYYNNPNEDPGIACPVGMAAATAMYAVEVGARTVVTADVPLAKTAIPATAPWKEHLQGHCTMEVPDRLFQFLYDAALRTLVLHSPGDVYPGPFTYKRFWFRDAAFILNAMLVAGLLKNVEKILDRFPQRQTASGYFKSQDGEWDSNGQALWIMGRFLKMTQTPLKPQWLKSMLHGARWIHKKRLFLKEKAPHAGLLPAGFSAEHFGPNDYYYWDDFWSVAGLEEASNAVEKDDPAAAYQFKLEAQDLLKSIEESLKLVQLRLNHSIIPASPYRRMDAGAIGCLVADYPLHIVAPEDARMRATVNFLFKKCFLNGAFYHEISHSGINAYLTLHVAQVLLRQGDPQFFNVVQAVAILATPTGQWPEAIHPQTLGGCMGDGQHVWAAAEWVLMMRNMFVREEEKTGTLILCSGIPEEWITQGKRMHFGPTLTVFGKISVTITGGENIKVSWKAQWHGKAPVIEVHMMGYSKQTAAAPDNFIEITAEERVAQKAGA